jgi:hypothetical protein
VEYRWNVMAITYLSVRNAIASTEYVPWQPLHASPAQNSVSANLRDQRMTFTRPQAWTNNNKHTPADQLGVKWLRPDPQERLIINLEFLDIIRHHGDYRLNPPFLAACPDNCVIPD